MASDKSRFPTKKDGVSESSVLFTDGEYHHQVVLNWLGDSAKDKLDFYAGAYHKAAKSLARRYSSKSTLRDFAGCPIVFLYRHSLELYLKAFLISGNKLLIIRRKPALERDPLLCGHRLMALLPGFERVLHELGWTWNMGVRGLRSKQDFVNLLTELDRVDQNSFSFRYPTDKQGKASLPMNFRFSVKIYATRMDALLHVLDGAVCGAEAEFDAEAEARQNTANEVGD